jgi:hypothetical protein
MNDSRLQPATLREVLAVKFRGEWYVIVYKPSQKVEALRTLGRWASDPQLSFTWLAAAVASQEIRCKQVLGPSESEE